MTIRSILALALPCALVACAGGGGSSTSAPRAPLPAASASAQPSPGAAGTSATGNAQFTITVPPKSASASAHRRRVAEISPYAQGLSISAESSTGAGDGANYVLSATAPGCRANSGGGFTCVLAVPAPAGSDTFTANVYDLPNFGNFTIANMIGTGTAQATITAGQSNAVNITIEGVPASATLTVPNAAPALGTPSTQALTVTAFDADGYPITGTYANPVTLAIAGSGLTLSTTSVASSTTPVTVTYTGANVFRADVYVPGATVTGSTSPASPLGDLPIQPGGPHYLYIVNQGSNAVYRVSLDGTTVTTIAGANTQLNGPAGVAVDPNGTIFVSNDGYPMVDQCIITSYAAGATGNVAPATSVAPNSGCFGGLVADGAYVYTTTYVSSSLALVVFPETASAPIAPALTYSTAYGTTNNGSYIAQDGAGDIAFSVNQSVTPTFATFAAASINKTPGTTVQQTASVLTGGSALASRNVTGIAFLPAGGLVVQSYDPTGATPNSLEEFAPGATGSAAPLSQIANYSVTGGGIAIAIDPAGYIYDYAPYSGAGIIVVYPPGATTNTAPLQTLSPANVPTSGILPLGFGGIAVH